MQNLVRRSRYIQILDNAFDFVGKLFVRLANICLILMMVLTALTIFLRPFDLDAHWMFPWTMTLFVWMTFFGLFAVYRFKRDIVIDIFSGRASGAVAQVVGRIPSLVVMIVCLTILWQLPTIIKVQRGPIDGALLPGFGELDRIFLSIPLALSLLLTSVQSMLDLLLNNKAGLSTVDASQADD